MKTTLTCLALLSLSAVSMAQDGDSTTYSAETYGGVSGDTPLRGLGLVLELVDGGTSAPKLRLFGGPAGQSAAIVLSSDAAEVAGPRGSTRLVADQGLTLTGAFDWRGYYEVPITGRAASVGNFHAQGMHTGSFDLAAAGEPLVQFSNGLHVFPTSDDDSPITFDDLLLHLPEDVGDLALTTSLAERLQRYLNSAGDSTKIKLHIEGNGGYFANGGAEAELEFLIERTGDGFYEIKIAADLVAKVGVEVAEGLEASAKGGYGATRIFRFNSAPGAARGLFGIMMGLQYPSLTPGRWIANSGLLPDAEQAAEALKVSIQFAQEHADEAEALLFDVLEAAVRKAVARRTAARARMQRAARNLAAASWRQRPYRAMRLAMRTAQFAATEAQVQIGTTARVQGQRALDRAKAIVETHREELRAVLGAAARLQRIASALFQLRGFTADHYVGTELRYKASIGAQLAVPIPVKTVSLGAGVAREVQVLVSVLFERPVGHTSHRIVVTRQLEDKGTASAAYLAGAEYEYKSTGTLVETFDFEPGQGFQKTTTASIARDTSLRGWVSYAVAVGTGIGRNRSLSIERDFSIDQDFELGAFLMGEGRDRLGETEVGLALQDRRVRTVECDLIVSVAGNGGGFALDIEWADQGRQLSRSKTIREAVEDLFDGPDQVPDPESGSVVTN